MTAKSRAVLSPLGKFLYWTGVAGLSFLFCEFTLWVWDFAPRYALTARGIDYALPFTLDHSLLYKLVPAPKHHINRAGFRDVEFSRKAGSRRIVVIGDSFPMGLVVKPSETFPKVLEGMLPKTEVLNLGIQGYGPDQELVVYNEIARELSPELVLWSLFPSNDFNDLIKNKLFQLSGDERLERVQDNPIANVLWPIRSPYLFRLLVTGHFLDPHFEESLPEMLFRDSEAPVPVDASTRKLMRAVMKEMIESVKRDPVPLVALVIPSNVTAFGEDKGELDRETLAICTELNLSCIDATETLKGRTDAYSSADRHLSITGHRLVAELIAPNL